MVRRLCQRPLRLAVSCLQQGAGPGRSVPGILLPKRATHHLVIVRKQFSRRLLSNILLPKISLGQDYQHNSLERETNKLSFLAQALNPTHSVTDTELLHSRGKCITCLMAGPLCILQVVGRKWKRMKYILFQVFRHLLPTLGFELK